MVAVSPSPAHCPALALTCAQLFGFMVAYLIVVGTTIGQLVEHFPASLRHQYVSWLCVAVALAVYV